MEIINTDDTSTINKYAIQKKSTEESIWKRSNCYVKNVKKLKRIVINIIVNKIDSHDSKYQFGVRVPRNISKAYHLYAENGNPLWSDAIYNEFWLLWGNFGCFCVVEENEIYDQHQKITLLWRLAFKFYGNHCAQLCTVYHKKKDLET